mmetsp:Transcript_80642/g.134806  ORF Transcript_80642/g.134806 Transcript_80642/m.134806 type:complete len:85 (-) Transcript_80642:129-383(-)
MPPRSMPQNGPREGEGPREAAFARHFGTGPNSDFDVPTVRKYSAVLTLCRREVPSSGCLVFPFLDGVLRGPLGHRALNCAFDQA